MKKEIFLSLFLFIATFQFSSAQSQVPYGDFEQWGLTFFGTEDPWGWSTSNGQRIEDVKKDSGLNAYHGKYSMLLSIEDGAARPEAWATFGLSQHPVYLIGYVKLFLTDSDTASIKITLYENSLPIDSGYWEGTIPINNFTQVRIPISQNNLLADSAYIDITEKNMNPVYLGSKFWVDYLSFDSTTGIAETENEKQLLNVYPNPVSDFINMKFNKDFYTQGIIYLYDLMGNKLREINVDEIIITGEIFSINLSDLPQGLYFLKFECGDEEDRIKIMKLQR